MKKLDVDLNAGCIPEAMGVSLERERELGDLISKKLQTMDPDEISVVVAFDVYMKTCDTEEERLLMALQLGARLFQMQQVPPIVKVLTNDQSDNKKLMN